MYTQNLVTADLDLSQEQFLFTIAQPYLQTGEWPTWDYVHAAAILRGVSIRSQAPRTALCASGCRWAQRWVVWKLS